MVVTFEQQVYAMSLSRAGAHFGHSIACPPWLEPAATGSGLQPSKLGDAEGVLPLVVEERVLQKIRAEYSFRRDRHRRFGGLGDGSPLSKL